MTLSEKVGHLVFPLGTHDIYDERNMENISPNIAINIYRTHSNIKNIYVDADCSTEKIQTYTDLFKEFHDIFS